MPYICLIRTDVPDNTLQVLDLKPNDSQRNLVYEPDGQSKYLRRVRNDAIVLGQPGGGGNPIITAATYNGLRAWLVDHIEDTPGGVALEVAQIDPIATALLAAMDSAAVLTVAAVNVIVQATVAGSGIGIGNSTGTLAGLLEVLSGADYVVPVGSVVDLDGSTYNTTVLGTMSGYRHIYDTSSLKISAGSGFLSTMLTDNFDYDNVESQAVVIYADDGNYYV